MSISSMTNVARDRALGRLPEARGASRRLKHERSGVLPQDLQFSPGMTEMLATAYVETDRADKAVALRLDEADRYRANGDQRDMERVLKGVDSDSVPDEIADQYPTLIHHIQMNSTVIQGNSDPVSSSDVEPESPYKGAEIREAVAVDMGSLVRSRETTLTPDQLKRIQTRIRESTTAYSSVDVRRIDWSGLPGKPIRMDVGADAMGRGCNKAGIDEETAAECDRRLIAEGSRVAQVIPGTEILARNRRCAVTIVSDIAGVDESDDTVCVGVNVGVVHLPHIVAVIGAIYNFLGGAKGFDDFLCFKAVELGDGFHHATDA